MINPFLRNIVIALIPVFIFTACHKKEKEQEPVAVDSTQSGAYFSIREFALDQWNNFKGSPFTVMKTTTIGDKVDSVIIAADTMEWADIFKTFFESDISAKKFSGHYNFSSFDENMTGTRNYFYEAKDNDLFTRRVILGTDPMNDKIKSVYIETAKGEGDNRVDQKLYYSPLKLIQIQRIEKGKVKSVTVYRFMI